MYKVQDLTALKIPSPREQEVLIMLSEGMSVPQMSAVMGIAPSTVKIHKDKLYIKLNVHSIAQAIMVGVERGLIPL